MNNEYLAILGQKKDVLKKLIVSDRNYLDPQAQKKHQNRVNRAKQFTVELEEASLLLNSELNVKQVSRSSFFKELKSADMGSLEFDGLYCKIALLQNFGSGNLWIFYTNPLNCVYSNS